MATIMLVGKDLEEPRLKVVRVVSWGQGYRYLIAEGPGSLMTYLGAYRDTCTAFPACPVLLIADWGNHCEVLFAQQYSALPAFFGA